MGMLHTALKVFMVFPLMSAPIMILAGLGLMECPAMLCNANGGSGPNKFDWASGVSDVDASSLLILVGVCKLAAILDIYVLNIIPMIALACVSIMMLIITYAHTQVGDDLPPVIFFSILPWLIIATWPAQGKKAGGKKL